MKIRVTLMQEMLGTKAASPEVFADFIASKCPDDDLRKKELDTAEKVEESGTTVFHRTTDGELMIYDYQFKGFLKEAGDIMRQSMKNLPTKKPGEDNPPEAVSELYKKSWGAMKKKIDNFLFVYPREISMGVTEPYGVCERPLRCETMRGPRVSLARSEMIESGTSFEIEIKMMPGSPITEEMLIKMLDYGQFKGLGQWRNSGKGQFEYEILD